MADEKLDDLYTKPPVLGKWEAFCQFVWNPKTREFFGRTGISWAKIGFFYVVFYAGLGVLIAIFFSLFYQTLDLRVPKWQLDRSLIGTNPGLGVRPLSIHNEESSLIWLKSSNKTNYLLWRDNLLEFLDKYYTPSKMEIGNSKIKTCTHWDYPNPRKDEVCKVDPREWGECNKDQFFNYHKSSPCIFIKLNKIFGWVPQYYDNPSSLPADMPKQLKDHIRGLNHSEERKSVWVSCQGENPADIEYLGPVTYYPKRVQGFPGYYFPYENSEGYLSPLVAIRFERPKHGVVINVECRAWAKNIIYDRYERTGSVHFELLVD